MDHLIHMLVKEFIPDVEHHHKWQSLGMEGPNLAEKRHCQILTCAPKTPIEKIQKIDNLHFEVQSSNSNKYYQIDLSTITCDCSYYPNISLCKHIAVVVHFFGGAELGPQPPDNGTSDSSNGTSPIEPVEYESPAQPVGSSTCNTIILAANDSIKLLQHLITKAPSDPKIAKSLNLIQSQISALLLATAVDDARLPEKENISPNQHFWPETAARMGEKCGMKCCQGKVDSVLMAQHISEPNRKHANDDDPYGAGEQSGK